MKMTAKIIIILIFMAFFFNFQSLSVAQEYENDSKKQDDVHRENPESLNNPLPGMEIRKIGGINMMVPEGTQFYMQGAQLKMEEASEYSARRFKEMDERFRKMEERQLKLEEEVKELHAQLANPHTRKPVNPPANRTAP